MERLTTCNLHGVSQEMPCAALHRPPSSVPPVWDSLLLSSKGQDVDLVHKEGEEGRSKMKGVVSNYQQLGRVVSVQGKHLPLHTGHAVRRPLPTTLPASQVRALSGTGSGVEVGQIMCCCWTGTGMKPNIFSWGRTHLAELQTWHYPQTLATAIKEAFIYLFLQ